MNLSRNWKIVVSLTGLFLFGATSGAFLALTITRQSAVEEKWTHRTLRDYEQRLQLTPEQVAKLRPLFRRTGVELHQIRAVTVTNLHTVIRRMNEQVAQELTDEQQRIFLKILNEKQPRHTLDQ
jgi:hypothetical protein